MVHTSSCEISRVSHYSGFYLVNLSFIYRTLTFSGLVSHLILLDLLNRLYSPLPGFASQNRLGSSFFARHYSRNRLFSFFSCRYLDVSVPCVPFNTLLYSCINELDFPLARVSSFGYQWIIGYLLLPIAFRSLSRPSSALGA